MSILLTGGAGYIGSHTALALLEAGYDVVALDNLSNSSPESLGRVEALTGRSVSFVQGDVRDSSLVQDTLERHGVTAVVHFAGLKAVGDSVKDPLSYFDNNVGGTIALCRAMETTGVKTLVFSSSATVYGEAAQMPLHEGSPVGVPTNPYGRSKLMVETLLGDLHRSDPTWSIALLRYFNPAGAHESGRIGEDPNGIPNNLLPYITQVAAGRLDSLAIYGGDYPTADGTGVRDYIHVMDLADGHKRALEAITPGSGLRTWNLGAGRGYSVLEILRAFEEISDQKIPYRIVARREGDVAECWANTNKAVKELAWRCRRDLDDILRDAWRWQTHNPYGYRQ